MVTQSFWDVQYIKLVKNDVKFNANHEGGNLDLVIQTGPDEFDLFMRIDTNTKGHTSWFNFKMHVKEKGRKIKINIVNFRKSNNMFVRGHKPFYKSKKADNDWVQGGDNIEYKLTRLKYFPVKFISRKKYHTLSFEYTTEYENDEI